MTRLTVWTSPAAGCQAVDQCSAFRLAARRRLGAHPDVSLVVVRDEDRQTCRVEAFYTVREPEAVAWAEMAAREADAVWAVVEKQNKERTRR